MIKRSLVTYLCILTIILSGERIMAQSVDPVTYEDFNSLQAKFLSLLKTHNNISRFTSMKRLKKDAFSLAENTIVPVDYKTGERSSLNMEQILKKRRTSVPVIWRYTQETTKPEKITTFASAILLSTDGVCATNYHVLRSLIDTAFKLNSLDSLMFVSLGDKIYPISRILSYNKAADLAIFKIDAGKDVLLPFPIGKDLSAGANVNTLTHVAGYMNYYSKGVVSRNFALDATNPFTYRTEITADYAKGSSGGAIFDDFGNLVGMVSSTNSIYYTDSPQINFQMVVRQVIPISTLKLIIKRNLN